MPPIDFNNLSLHVLLDRSSRFDLINSTIGFGEYVCNCDDPTHEGCDRTLTSTGVMVVRNKVTNKMVTLFVATMTQALDTYYRGTGKTKMPHHLWNTINYNNNTAYWKRVTA